MPDPTPKPADQYSKTELNQLIDRMKSGDAAASSECAAFAIAESLGIWHGRARAKMCRNFKNHPPEAALCDALVTTVARRLETGRFSEQFKDQLRMAMRFDPERMRNLAVRCESSGIPWTRRYATWILITMRAQRLIPSDASADR